MPQNQKIASAVVISIGLAVAGIATGLGFYKGRAYDRFVTVKGLAEREVMADLAIWPITFQAGDNDLGSLQNGIDESRRIITEFLLGNGFEIDQISYSAPVISDTRTQISYGKDVQSEFRYIARSTVTTRTGDIALVKETMEKSGELVGRGVVLGEQSWQNPTEFLFTGLNDIKPEMIQEATTSAREAAEKFAKDSGSKVGKIRNATQGYFSINDRDRNSPDVKKVRVVTTVQYYLVD